MGLFDGVPFLIETPQQISARWEQGQARFQQGLQFAAKLQEDRRQFNEMLKLKQQGIRSEDVLNDLRAKTEAVRARAAEAEGLARVKYYDSKLDEFDSQMAQRPALTDYLKALSNARGLDEVAPPTTAFTGDNLRMALSAYTQTRQMWTTITDNQNRMDVQAQKIEYQRDLLNFRYQLPPDLAKAYDGEIKAILAGIPQYATPTEVSAAQAAMEQVRLKYEGLIDQRRISALPGGTQDERFQGGTVGSATNAPAGPIAPGPETPFERYMRLQRQR